MWCQLNRQQFWPPGVWDSGHSQLKLSKNLPIPVGRYWRTPNFVDEVVRIHACRGKQRKDAQIKIYSSEICQKNHSVPSHYALVDVFCPFAPDPALSKCSFLQNIEAEAYQKYVEIVSCLGTKLGHTCNICLLVWPAASSAEKERHQRCINLKWHQTFISQQFNDNYAPW